MKHLLPALAWVIGPPWIAWTQIRLHGSSRGLSEEERRVLSPFYSQVVLQSVRVVQARKSIGAAPLMLLRVFGIRGSLVTGGARGMAIGRTIIVAHDHQSTDHAWILLLFHELVHVVQYRLLGTPGLCARYIGEWQRAGFSYFEIGLEKCAYELQDEFDRRPEISFDVSQRTAEYLASRT